MTRGNEQSDRVQRILRGGDKAVEPRSDIDASVPNGSISQADRVLAIVHAAGLSGRQTHPDARKASTPLVMPIASATRPRTSQDILAIVHAAGLTGFQKRPDTPVDVQPSMLKSLIDRAPAPAPSVPAAVSVPRSTMPVQRPKVPPAKNPRPAGQQFAMVRIAPGASASLPALEKRLGHPVASMSGGKQAWLAARESDGAEIRAFIIPNNSRGAVAGIVGELAAGVTLWLAPMPKGARWKYLVRDNAAAATRECVMAGLPEIGSSLLAALRKAKR